MKRGTGADEDATPIVETGARETFTLATTVPWMDAGRQP